MNTSVDNTSLVNRGLGNGQCILKETVSNDFQLFPFIECRLINSDGKALLFFRNQKNVSCAKIVSKLLKFYIQNCCIV